MFNHLENKMHKELEMLEEKYRTGTEMSEGDLRRIDLLAHSLKSLATYCAMKEATEYNNNSYSNYPANNSYMNSYQGHDDRFINRDMSGYRPYPMYPDNRRW